MGVGGCFGLARVGFGVERVVLGLGMVVLGDVFLGGYGGTGWVRRLVGWVLGAGVLCWDMSGCVWGLEGCFGFGRGGFGLM